MEVTPVPSVHPHEEPVPVSNGHIERDVDHRPVHSVKSSTGSRRTVGLFLQFFITIFGSQIIPRVIFGRFSFIPKFQYRVPTISVVVIGIVGESHIVDGRRARHQREHGQGDRRRRRWWWRRTP